MTDLRIYVDISSQSQVLPSATATCGSAPPSQSRGSDTCRLGVALTLDAPQPGAPRLIFFDRQGDSFVLSRQNSPENLNWVTSNQNLPSVLTTLRLAGALFRSLGPTSTNSDTASYFLWLSRYIMTGNYRHDDVPAASPEPEFNEILIDAFSGGGWHRGTVNLLGGLTLLRREAWLPEEARERISSVTAILDIVPIYQGISRHFFSEERARTIYRLGDQQFRSVARIFQFLRRLAIALREGRPLRFDRTALEASRAYAEFYRIEIASGTQPEFCAVLDAALNEVGAPRGAAGFIAECRQALAWAAVPPEQALRESARQTLTDAAGMQRLQQAIAEESGRANMRIEWLSHRAAYSQVLEALLNRISLVPASAAGTTARLGFDFAGFGADLRRLTMLTNRGEYDLSALAFLRRLFGREGNPPALRVFSEGLLGDLDWNLSGQDLTQLRALQASLEGRRRSSVAFSQYGMPAMLGSACAVGVGGLVLSQVLPALRSNGGAQLGLGIPSAGLAGGGCLGFAGHFFWPAVAPRAVHNRNAWDVGTSLTGSALGIGTYMLIHFLTGGQGGPGQRFPVDPFGP